MQNEIKKAWETMKRELKKETGIENGFVMNARQIANRTATKWIISHISFEDRIHHIEENIARARGMEGWAEEKKERAIRSAEDSIRELKELREKYGSPIGMANSVMDAIEKSAAFSKFQKVAGRTRMHIEIDRDGMFIIRFNY